MNRIRPIRGVTGVAAGLAAAVALALPAGAGAAPAPAARTAATVRHPARMIRVTPTVVLRARSASAPRRYRIVGGSFIVPNGSQTGALIDCPLNTVPLSGGVVQSSKSLGVNINSTYPAVGDNGWAVLVNNTSGQAISAEIQVICAKKPYLYTVVESGEFENPVGTQTGAIVAACPAGTKVFGGGDFMSNGYTGANLNTSMPEERFLHPPTYWWVVTANNTSTEDNFVNAFAVCGKERGYYLAQGANVDNPPGMQSFASVICPAPTTVIGGGSYSSSPSPFANINSTYVAANGWNAYENNGGTTDAILFPVALCAT